ncbi:hypothetical protein DPMN_142210 [Dreissena polymorpha]|uniref:Uncharacterized protein n=1 Tax=Dreissena polymorpha TaxID=45954 RepID=A0A9D4GB83_DREPO|nr:hypothetical protein DPMN_142210 [Dreissena polymorpha]
MDGIISRYSNAGVPPPKKMYTDSDCCGRQSIKNYFDAWPFLHVRLDLWHFMRRFPNGCTTDKHQLFVPFMACLSGCIFEIDQGAYFLLMRAKQEELLKQGVPDPSYKDVAKHITSDEVGRHC